MTDLEEISQDVGIKKPSTLFSDIKFIIAQCHDTEVVRTLLIEGGAKLINYLSEHVTLVISDTNCPEAEEAVDLFDKPVVNSLWVHLSLKANKLLPIEAFSPIRSIFHDAVVSFSTSLSRNDIENLASTLTFYGARLSKNAAKATHLIVASASDTYISEVLCTLRQQSPELTSHIKTVAPDWVLESVKANHCCDEQIFDPKLLLPPPPPTPPKQPTPPPQPTVEPQLITKETSTREPSSSIQASGSAAPVSSAIAPSTIRTNSSVSTAADQRGPRFSNPNMPQSQIKPPSQLHHHHHPQQHIQHQLNQQQQHPQSQPHPQQQQIHPHLQQQPQHLHLQQQQQQQQLHQNSLSPYQQSQQHMQFYPNQTTQHQQMQTLPPSQLPRARMPANVIRGGSQHKFRPILPSTSINTMPNMGLNDTQQPKKVNIQYGQCRKVAPYQNNLDSQVQSNQIHQQPHQESYVQQQHQQGSQQNVNFQQPIGTISQPSRLPQPNMYNQVRVSYQNNHFNPRAISQQPQPQQQQQTATIQQPPQIPHMVNRFQESSSPMAQRPYQVCLQPQSSNHSSYQAPSGAMPQQRQPVFYSQPINQPPPPPQPQQQIQMRLPQQGPQLRHIQNDVQQNVYDGYHQQQPQDQSAPASTSQHHYQISTPASVNQQQYALMAQKQHGPQQQQQMVQQPTQTPVMQPRQQFSTNYGSVGSNMQHVRTPRATFSAASTSTATTIINHQHEFKANNITNRHPNPINIVGGPVFTKGPWMPNNNIATSTNNVQQKPHPSIFNHIQESNLAQIKAKVPTVKETSSYFGYAPKESVPKDLPLIGCRFKLIGYEHIHPKKREKWLNAIKLAGGSFEESIENITHLICEDQTSSTFSLALEMRVRCVTIYWVNDVIAENNMSYPWKALHLPVPFSKEEKPLSDEIISITNFKGKERLEVKEMILKTGAQYTDYFSSSNTLIVCGYIGGEKYERAIEWKIPFVNCQLLSDILLCRDKSLKSLLSHTKYHIFNRDDSLKLQTYSSVQDLMRPWTKSLMIVRNKEPETETSNLTNGTAVNCSTNHPLNTNDDSGLATGGSNNSDIEAVNGKSNPSTGENSHHDRSTTGDGISGSQITTPRETVQNDGCGAERSQSDKNADPSVPITEISLNKNDEGSIQLVAVKQSNEVELVVPSIEPKTGDDTTNSKDLVSAADKLEVAPRNNRAKRSSVEPIRVLFTHLESALVDQLKKFALELGMGFATSPINCTHLIVDRISRTPKFICAFSHAGYILSYQWITASHEAKYILDEKQFTLRDKLGEEKYSLNLAYSLSKRQKRGRLLFLNIVFFVTPTVLTSVTNVKEMIESAGGIVAIRKLPTKMQLDQLKAEGKRFVMVTCKQDLHLCSAVESSGIDIVSIEFVICGILRQDIDFEAHRINIKTKNAIAPFVRPETTNPTTHLSQPTPPKKLRLDDSSC